MLPVYCQRTEVARPNLAHDKNTYFSDKNTTVQYTAMPIYLLHEHKVKE